MIVGLPIQKELKTIFENANINSSDMHLTSLNTGVSISTVYSLVKGTAIVTDGNTKVLHSLLIRCSEKAQNWEALSQRIKNDIKTIK